MNSLPSDSSFFGTSLKGAVPFAWVRPALLAYAAGKTLEESLGAFLEGMCRGAGWSRAGIVKQEGRDWGVVTGEFSVAALPIEAVAEAVDRGANVRSGEMLAIPLRMVLGPRIVGEADSGGLSPMVLVVDPGLQSENSQKREAFEGPSETPRGTQETRGLKFVSHDALIQEAAEALGLLLALTWGHERLTGRARRLEAMLRIAAKWTEFDECEKLLVTIADSASKLLGAERASIFLWDKKGKKLVGRPALGVEGNRLEVPDSQGIVGAVLQSGQAKRWHEQEDAEREVNREVDRTLQFKTKSLLAVPLWHYVESEHAAGNLFDPSGIAKEQKQGLQGGEKRQAIGVFELINRIDGVFTREDEEALAELAVLASSAIRNAQRRQRLIEDREHLVSEAASGVHVVGEHETVVAVRASAARVAKTDLSVLVLGENGTGKEVLARSIHYASPRRHHPFVAVNCAAIVESLLESELFGHEKGAFTDAQQTRAGKFELANGGTIFLDEIGDLSPGGQAKLLRVLEERKVYRVGGSQMIDVDVRVIAATNQPLAEMVQAKRFREDLFFRLNTVTLRLPPLRERGADVVTLAKYFLEQFAQQVGRRLPVFSPDACEALQRYRWPGNIRELRNLVERVAYLCPEDVIELEELGLEFAFESRPAGMRQQEPAFSSATSSDERDLAEATRLFQIRHIEEAIAQCNGNMTEAATSMGLHRSNLYRKMRQLGMVDG